VKYWEIIARNLKKRGWSLGYVSAVDSRGRTIWIADAHRDDGKRFVVRAEEKLTGLWNWKRPVVPNGNVCKLLEFHANPSCFWTAGISPLGHLKVESSNILGLGCVVNVFVCVLRINTNPDVRRVAGSKIHVPPIMHLCRRGEEAKVKTFCLRLVRPFWVWP